MASRLTPCPSCSRHVKVGPPSCPFCGGDVPTEVAPRAVALPAGRALSRAAIMLAGAAAVTACSSSSTTTPPTDAQADTGQVHAAYGAMMNPQDATTGDDAGDDEAGHPVAAYGVIIDATAIEPDAGVDATADADHGQLDAAYGVIIDAGSPAVDASDAGTADSAAPLSDGGH